MSRNPDPAERRDRESTEPPVQSPDSGDDLARATAAGDGEMVYADTERADDEWLTRGLGTTMLLAGAVLFLIPEPATSMLGAVMMAVGLAVWAASALR